MIPNRFVILWNNQPIGIDSNSGGYPFKTEVPGLIQYWRTEDEAQDYINVMQRGNSSGNYSDMKVVEIQFRIMDKS